MDVSPAILAAREKLKARFNDTRTGGKGSSRRKKCVVHVNGANADKKLQGYLKRIGAQQIDDIQEVFMFLEDSSVLHFNTPKFYGSVPTNTFAVIGKSNVLTLEDFARTVGPALPNYLGIDNMNQIAKLAAKQGLVPDDDDVPDLVGENFEEVSKH